MNAHLRNAIGVTILTLLTLFILASGAFATATITQTATVPLTIVDFDTSVTVPQFDPSLGELQSVLITLDGHVQGDIRVENLSGLSTPIVATIGAELHLHNPSHVDIVIISASTAKNYTLGPFDGVVDFGGASGVTDVGVTADDTDFATITDPDPNFALFVGAGTVTLPVHSVGSSNVTGSASLATSLLTQASAVVTVVYTYGIPAIDLEKHTNGEDADAPTGPFIPVGDPVLWEFIVTNTGETLLTNIVVTDNILGAIGTIPSLAPGASQTLTANGTAVAGQYANVGTAVGEYSGGAGTVTDTDPSHYFGSSPSIDIEKLTNGDDADSPTGPIIPVGGAVTWTFVVTNTGNVTLTNVVVTDSILGLIGTIPSLAPGESQTLTATGTAVAGQYENAGTAVGTPPVGPNVTDTDLSHYFGSSPSIDIEKHTNGQDADSPTGPIIPVGGAVLWEFIVTNTGNVTLTDILVTDDILGVIGTIPSLAPGASATLTANGTAVAGQYANIGRAEGTPPVGPNVFDTDPSHYFGAEPSIDIEKYTNGEDADSPTGPIIPVGGAVTWTFVVTNTGNVTLTDIVVTDSILGVVGTIPSLAPGASATLTATGTAVAGQYENAGTAVGNPPAGPPVTDTDLSHYFGSNPSIDIEKHTNGEDADSPTGPNIPVGGTVTWTYIVTNTGNVTLTNIVVTDNVTGAVGTIPSLAPGESATLTVTGVAVAGQYANIGRAEGTPPVGPNVFDTDPSHYFGAVITIDVEKYVSVDNQVTWDDADTAPGPDANVGADIFFKFVVTNTGNVTLSPVTLTDNVYTINPADVPASLAAGASFTIILGPFPAEAGQHTNTATATGISNGTTATDSDNANYNGVAQFQGLTPGYWKNHPESWEGYTPDQLVGSVFTIPGSLSSLADDTLMEALSYKGGSTLAGAAQILLRAAVAAILNAANSNINYPLTEAQIIADVNTALASGNRATILALATQLDQYNNLEGVELAPVNPNLQLPNMKPEQNSVPNKTRLLKNYPNPFNPETWIPYQLAETANVRIQIFNITGNVVRTLDLGNQSAGYYMDQSKAAYWDGKNEANERVSSGIYFYTIQAGGFSATSKMVVEK